VQVASQCAVDHSCHGSANRASTTRRALLCTIRNYPRDIVPDRRGHPSRSARGLKDRDVDVSRIATSVDIVVESTLGDHREAWDRLVDAAPVPSPFLRSWWLEPTTGPGARFVMVLRTGQLLGGVALTEDRVAGLPRLRSGDSPLKPDHLDLVAAPGEVGVVVDTLRSWFVCDRPTLIDLRGVADHARVVDVLPRPVRATVIGFAPWTALPSTYEEYLAARPSQLRNSLRRAERRLARLGCVHRVVDPDLIDDALATLRRLHALRFQDESGLLPCFEQFAEAARRGARRGEVVCHELLVDGEARACEIWFEVGGVGSFYQSGRDPDPKWDGAGTVLKARAIERLCERGFTHIDLLRDDEPYKRSWAPDARRLLRVEAAVGMRARGLETILPLARRAKRAMHRLASKRT